MGEVIQLVPSITFSHAPNPSVVHAPSQEDAVVMTDANVALVTTVCGFVGLGLVKYRRGINCGLCLAKLA